MKHSLFWIIGTLALAGSAAAASLSVSGLTTEFVERPMGVDVAHPRLGWKLQSQQRAQQQHGYRILVASSPQLLASLRGDVWDSGRVASDRTLEIPCGGAVLKSGARYYWKVKVWDSRGGESEWSPESSFEMGLLSPNDWQGEWIGWASERTQAPVSLENANWIWASRQQEAASGREKLWFRKTFILPEGKPIREAVFAGAGDDDFILYVNGREAGKCNLWSKPICVQLSELMRPGRNVIAIQASNDVSSPGGLIGKLQVTFTDGSVVDVPTEGSWKSCQEEQKQWREPSFDDSGWADTQIVTGFGGAPWGELTLPPLKELPPLGAPLLRKEFTLNRAVSSARLFICGLGLHELRLNGKPVGDAVLNPAHTQYDKRVLYATHDVTQQLQTGANCIGVELGRGFFSVLEQTPWRWREASLGWPRMICQLNIRFADGTQSSVISDGSWQLCTEGPTTYDSIYWGEQYDARKEKAGWDQPGYNGEGFVKAKSLPAPSGQLRSQMLPPMKVVETFRPVLAKSSKPNCYVFDAGIVTTGWIRLKAACPAGTKVTIRYAERLRADGSANTFVLNENNEPTQTDSYTFKGQGTETWEPKFSYKGFKYIEVIDCPVPLTAENVEVCVVRTDLQTVGSFECSNPEFNKLHENMVRTLQNNFHGKPTDTPTYEKNGWTGDANFALDCMFYNFDLTAFMAKWMQDCEDSMDASGNVPVIVPAGVWGYAFHPVWSSVYVYGLQALQDYAGAAAPFREHFNSLNKYTAYNLSRLVDGIVTDAHRKGHGVMCDHLAPGLEERSTGQAPPEGGALGSTAYLYGTLQIMGDKAGALGEAELAKRYREAAVQMLKAFNGQFLDSNSGVYHTDILEIADKKDPRKMIPVGYRQTSNLIALAFKMVPADLQKAVVENLVRDVVSRNYHLDTGAAGTRHILPILTESGHGDIAYKVATQTTYPSWGHQLSLGATTMWEAWRTPRSNNHYFMGTIDEWFFRHLAGIGGISEGFKEITIKPYLLGDLSYARASIDSVRGLVASSWTCDADKGVRLEVTVPVNAVATVYVPTPKESIVQADSASTGTQFLRNEDGFTVYRVPSGKTIFTASKPPSGPGRIKP